LGAQLVGTTYWKTIVITKQPMERCHNQVCMIGVEFVGGNMFENIPFGDAIFMKVLLAFLIIYIHQNY